MAFGAPPALCPKCGAQLPWGESAEGVHRYHCVHCGHRFESAAPAQQDAQSPPPAQLPAAPAVNPYAVSPADAAARAGSASGEVCCPQCRSNNPARYQFCLKCGGSLQGGEQRAAAADAAMVTCPACRQRVVTAAFCGACAAPLYSRPQPAPTAARRGKLGAVGKLLGGGFGLFWLLFIGLFICPRACYYAHSSDAQTLAFEAVRSCPAARAALGEPIEPAWVGCNNGSSRSDGTDSRSRFNTTVSGSLSRGTLGWAAESHGGRTQLVGAWLQAGDQQIDLLECNSKGKAQSGDVEINDNSSD